MRFFSYKNRPVHLGPLPTETLPRSDSPADLSGVKTLPQLSYDASGNRHSLVNALGVYARYIDASRNGPVAPQKPEIPSCPRQRAEQIKALGYYLDASQIGCCALSAELRFAKPYTNPDLDALDSELKAIPRENPGFHHMIAHGLQYSIEQNKREFNAHTHCIVLLHRHFREIRPEETAFDWLCGTSRHNASVRASETAVVIANFIRNIGFEARVHTESTTDIDLAKAAVAAGIAEINADGDLCHPYLGKNFAVAAITTELLLQADQPLATRSLKDRCKSFGPRWWFGGGWGLGKGVGKGMGAAINAFNLDPYKKRSFESDTYGLKNIKRRDVPTTLIDAERIPRVPKRSDIFWRAAFGDMGKDVQATCVDDFYTMKTAVAAAQYHLIGALHLLDRRNPVADVARDSTDPEANAKRVKSVLYSLGVDMVGISEAPDWVWYSHGHDGEAITPCHKYAITLLIDQGHETMEGASGDDWIAASQSMRAYSRGMLLGGVVAEQIRNLGYSAWVHSVVDSDVIHTPLMLLSGLGEISRIGETAINPFLGPRTKTTVVTTDMPLALDKPIDFGLQAFCNACKKCARECPSGAISAGPKLMFNGYETWKADVEKCGRYRLTQDKGAMCGRCMKTCPWNLEGIFIESPFRWIAMKVPRAAKWLARLDDRLGHGSINPAKKWWWDIETTIGGVTQMVPAERVNTRGLNLDIDLQYKDQTLACYPADLAPAPIPVVQPMDREAAINRYRSLLTPEDYKARVAAGDTENLVPAYRIPEAVPETMLEAVPPVQYLRIADKQMIAESVVKLELERSDGGDLLLFEAGAHIDLVIDAPFIRQYSLAGDPADRKKYVLGILKEPEGRGGSLRAHERLHEGAIIAVTGPRNNFPLEKSATKSLLFGGGIGVTPLLAMAHQLHREGADFELHYCFRSRRTAGFIETLENAVWADRVYLHISEEGTRADLESLIGAPHAGKYSYVCGPNSFMDSVVSVCNALGWDDDQVRKEYFSVPEQGEYENFPFDITLVKSGLTVNVPADKTLAEVLTDNSVAVTTMCETGICGACTTPYLEGDIEHRDFVLSKKQREQNIIVCCSRALPGAKPLVLDL